jgi:hypothetical protein
MFIKYLNIYIIIIISVSEEHTISVYDGKEGWPLILNRHNTPSKPLEQCYSGSLLIVEFMVMNWLTD